jgi:DNA-binding transcriptional regulator YhcF (GntR family)
VQATNLIEGEHAVQESITTSTDIKSVVMTLDISAITRRASHCYREGRDEANVESLRIAFLENRIAVEQGLKPPHDIPLIKVWEATDNGEHVLLGGDHRTEGSTQAGNTTIQAIVYYCSSDEAYLIGLEDNAMHGLQLNRGDKKVTIEKTLKRFPDKSLRWIATLLKCSVSYVSEVYNKLTNEGILDGDKKRKKSGTQPKKSASKNVPKFKLSEWTIERREKYAYEHIDNLVDDVSDQDAVDFLEKFIERCKFIHNHRVGIANNNGNHQATDQSADAT